MSAPVPGWLQALTDRLDTFPPLFPQEAPQAPPGSRRSAVLILFGPVGQVEGRYDDELARVDLLLTERSPDMRSHPGQVSFPGGSIDPGDAGPVEAALREAEEETGLDPSGVEVLGLLPEAYLAPSGFVVTPVLAWWAQPSAVGPVDPREVARVARVPVADLVAGPNRFRVRHPSGYIGPGFLVDGLFVWGATAQMLARVLTTAGLERPWDTDRFEPLPDVQVALRGASFAVIDIILLLLMAAYTVSGYRQGFLISASSLVGFLGCGALGMWLLPNMLSGWLQGPSDLRSSLILVGGVLICAALGQGVFGALGARLKNRVRFAPAHMVDAALGAVASLVAICLLTWFVAGAVRGVAGPVSRQIGRSHIVAALDDVIPARAAELFTGFRSLLDRGGFPKVFESLGPERILPIDPPDGAVAHSKAVREAARSIVKVTGIARSCSRSQEGSGWVVAPEKVVTNAHVVAGERSQVVRIGGTGTAYEAHVVLFDPKRDIAVLDVPGLPAPPLKQGPDVGRGTSAVVAGFPENGPYTVGAARVRQVIDATGNDIYDRPGIERQVYSLYAKVRPGNSGGPLLGTDGKVIGIVFATSLDDPNTGYALTMREAAPILEQAPGASTPVRTGGCATG